MCVCFFVCLGGTKSRSLSVNIMLMSVLILWFFFVISYFFLFRCCLSFTFFMCFYLSYQYILFRIWFWNMFFKSFLRIYFSIVDYNSVEFPDAWQCDLWLYIYSLFHFFSIRFLKLINFNCRIITLQHCDDACHTSYYLMAEYMCPPPI